MSASAIRLLADTARGRCSRRVERLTVAGLPTLAAGPSGDGPTLVFANACTERGIEEPSVAAFLGGVARAGLHAVAPELPDVRGGLVTPATVDALASVADQYEGPLVLAGASTGGALAILAAADARIAGRIELVSAIAPFADLANVIRLATTDHYVEDGVLHPHSVEPLLRWAVGRSVRALGDGAAVDALLDNTDPRRFDELFSALPVAARAAVDALSPVRAVPHVRAPVDVAADPRDTFFPPAEARALERAGARLTVTPALGHVRPRPGLGLARLVRFTDRMLLLRPALAT